MGVGETSAFGARTCTRRLGASRTLVAFRLLQLEPACRACLVLADVELDGEAPGCSGLWNRREAYLAGVRFGDQRLVRIFLLLFALRVASCQSLLARGFFALGLASWSCWCPRHQPAAGWRLVGAVVALDANFVLVLWTALANNICKLCIIFIRKCTQNGSQRT